MSAVLQFSVVFTVSVSPVALIESAIVSPRNFMCIAGLSLRNYTSKVHVHTHGLCSGSLVMYMDHVHGSCSWAMFMGQWMDGSIDGWMDTD